MTAGPVLRAPQVVDPSAQPDPSVLWDRPGLVVAAVAPVAPGSARAPREPWFDNVRLVAAVLVVVGHFIRFAPDAGGWSEVLWAATWAFRIPVFVLVAGLFSSADPLTSRRLWALIRDVVLVYLVFELVLTVQTWAVVGTVHRDPLVPDFGLWFLFSLVLWRLVLPLVARVPHLLVWSVVAAVLVGFVPAVGEQLSLSRSVAMFPWFVLGWELHRLGPTSRPSAPSIKTGALVAAACVIVGLGALARGGTVSYEDLLMRGAYRGDLAGQAGHALVRLGLLAAAVVGAIALLSLVPRRHIRFVSYLGAGSLFIYVLHLVVLNQAVSAGWLDGVDTAPEFALMVVAAVALALALGSPPVRWATRPFVRPRTIRLPGGASRAASGSGAVRRVR